MHITNKHSLLTNHELIQSSKHHNPPEHKISQSYDSKKTQSIWQSTLRLLSKAPNIFHYVGKGFISRKKIPETERLITWSQTHHDPTINQALNEVRAFDVISKMEFEKHPLNDAQIKMGISLINKYYNLATENKQKIEKLSQQLTKSNVENKKNQHEIKMRSKIVHESERDINDLSKLVAIGQKKNGTRYDFDTAEWQALDHVNFELTKNHLANLKILFNGGILEPQQKVMKENFSVNFKESLIAEALAKALAWCEGLDGSSIQVPVRNNQFCDQYHLEEYSIKLIKLGDNLPCYILEPSNPNSKSSTWVVPRGTNSNTRQARNGEELRTAARESVFVDILNKKGLAEEAIIKAMVTGGPHSLNSLFSKWAADGRRVIIAGHSLGGYFANDIAVRYEPQIAKAYCFSSPGVSKKLAAQWNDKTKGHIRNKIVNFDIEGDPIPSAGKKLIAQHIAIINSDAMTENPLQKHGQHNLLRPFKAVLIDNKEESKKLARKVSEKCRSTIGRVVKKILGKRALPDWHQNADKYRWLEKEIRNN